MLLKPTYVWATCCLSFALCTGLSWIKKEEVPPAQEDKKIDPPVPSRKDAVPPHIEVSSDLYLEGYVQALVDVNYYEYRVTIKVRHGKVYIYNLPKNELLANSIVSYVNDLPGVRGVEIMQGPPPVIEQEHEKYIGSPRVEGVWFPQMSVLFAPLIADPRQPIYSAALRLGDKVIGQVVAAVSLGDDFPIFRWRNVFPWQGDMQIGIEAGIWSVFNYWHLPKRAHEWSELVNTDFFVGIPLTYAVDKWSFRFRLYHISSHLGDEFLINNPEYIKKRKNLSIEAVDLFMSYQFSKHLRMYIGPGAVFHSDHSFPFKPMYIEYGTELRILGQKLDYHSLYGTPFFAMHIENWQERHWDFDFTFMLGYELSKLQGVGRKMRLFAEYHHGFSYEGQFFDKRDEYWEFGFSWGF